MPSHFSHVQLFVSLWTIAHRAPRSVGFSRQEYWSGVPFPSPGDLLTPGTECVSLRSPALAGGFFTTSATWEALINYVGYEAIFWSKHTYNSKMKEVYSLCTYIYMFLIQRVEGSSLSTEKRFLETHSPSIFWLYSLHLLNSKILHGAH